MPSLPWLLLSGSLLAFSLPSLSSKPRHLTTIDNNRLLRAIAAVEGNAWETPGGGYQFTRQTWFDYTSMPYAKAQQRDSATTVAVRILEDTISRLTKSSIEPTVYLLALRWRHGFAGMMQRRNDRSSYATRVSNLYLDPSFP